MFKIECSPYIYNKNNTKFSSIYYQSNLIIICKEIHMIKAGAWIFHMLEILLVYI
jgi:hypothetical protein